MLTFRKSVTINSDKEKIFNFHLDTTNISVISPPFPKVIKVEMSEKPLIKGSSVSLEIDFLFLRQEWLIKITEVIPGRLITDLQEKGPFKFWEHNHKFSGDNGAVVMSDEIRFLPPFGIFGWLALPFVYLQLYLMFSDRHRRTKKYFER
ncbi:MAG: hypothetical protein LCH52_04420 [Bacteroidetes bacterium]|nr:hypothetical protein [Bacteroidota bacterium]